MIELNLVGVRLEVPSQQPIVLLRERTGERYLPIWIGSFEAQAIATKISGNPLGRPLTHDLMATAFGDLGISVKRIVVTRLADQVFYARLYVKQNGRDLDFDARPSDAGHLTRTLASYTVTMVTLPAVSRLWRHGLKNSLMSGAVAEAPGKTFTPRPFRMSRNVLGCWYVVVDW